MSSLSVRFFNSFKSKYLNFFFYLFDCQVSFALIGFSFLHHRVLYVRLRCTSLDLGSALCAVVGLDGLEPSTSRLSGARSSHLSYRPVSLRLFSSLHHADFVWHSLSQFFQTVPRDSEPSTRLRRVIGVLSAIQLQQFSPHGARTATRKLVEMKGFEPLTPCLQGRCSPN